MSRFEQDRAAAAHRIEQRCAGNPTGEAKNPGGEIFPERRFSRGQAPAALEQRLPRGVEIERKFAIGQMALDRNIGLVGIYAGRRPESRRTLSHTASLILSVTKLRLVSGLLVAETSTRIVRAGSNQSVHGSA